MSPPTLGVYLGYDSKGKGKKERQTGLKIGVIGGSIATA